LVSLSNAHGSAIVSVIVRDDGSTARGAIDAVTNTFLVTVTPVNDAPVLLPVPNQIIAEGTLLTLTNVVTDPDLPEDQLAFSLVNPPAGTSIDASTGVFTWTPGEQQGPSSNLITVVVRDSGVPPLRATNRFNVQVTEVNQAPVLPPLPDRTVPDDAPLTFSAGASDADLPPNTLTYSLAAGAPAGASIQPATGLFAWSPGTLSVPSTNSVTVVVMDDGSPSLSDSRTFRLTILPRSTFPVIQSINNSAGTVTLRWSALPGRTYRVLAKSSLDEPNWRDLAGDVTANGSSAAKTDFPGAVGQRFYKVILLP
jgi:hypothetical protein